MNRSLTVAGVVLILLAALSLSSCNSTSFSKEVSTNLNGGQTNHARSAGTVEDKSTPMKIMPPLGCVLIDDKGRITGVLFMGANGDLVESNTR
ncbi:hypothetical protein DSCW_30060 [Desulfosarcina widdelii]|uniref:Lipoprotein n=1 Tax=Desulfosarcina widdelii TaxID=947919 RepID=A0A5K7Z5U6_9BACT|nr:hypothetical protein [Desulfosarcina widdelii]BBO75589.1 hypothetical protein DSCW_30060 [Desulfosarcina widdelii]